MNARGVRLRCPHCQRFYAVRTTDGGLHLHRTCPPVHESEVHQNDVQYYERKRKRAQ